MDGEQFSVGRVFSRGFGVIVRNPATVLGIGFLLGAIPMVALNFYQQSLLQSALDPDQVMGLLAVTYGSLLVSMVFQAIVQGSLVLATVADANGERASFGESLGAGLTVVLPLLGVSIVSTLGVVVGFALLIVPGVILYVMWSVAAPALVAERIGVIEALGRSRELTRGARGQVLGVIVILGVVSWIFVSIVNALMLGTTGFTASGVTELAANGRSVFGILFDGVLSTVTLTVSGTVMSSLYIELRTAKEGPERTALEDIFA